MNSQLMLLPVAALERVRRSPRKRGHAGFPGGGPRGETCGSCEHIVRTGTCRRTYFKCALIKWTHGAATDIRKRDPACGRWEQPEGENP